MNNGLRISERNGKRFKSPKDIKTYLVGDINGIVINYDSVDRDVVCVVWWCEGLCIWSEGMWCGWCGCAGFGCRGVCVLLLAGRRALEGALRDPVAVCRGTSRRVLAGRRNATVSITAVPRLASTGSKQNWWWKNSLPFRTSVRMQRP